MMKAQKSSPKKTLYGKETQKAVENFQLSQLKLPRLFLYSLGQVKFACARINMELGKLEPEVSEAMQKAAQEVIEGKHDAQFVVDVFQTGSGTSTNMNANEVIATLASEYAGQAVHPNDQVNLGQSSNDVIPSCIHVSAALAVSNQLLPALARLHNAIEKKAEQHQGVLKTGRTHLMDALPMSVAQELSGWQAQLSQAQSHIESCLPAIQALAIGGTAIGTGLNSHPLFGGKVAAELAQNLNIPFTSNDNKFAAISSQDAAVALSGALKMAAVAVSKIANDIRWLNSGPISGISEIQLEELQAGSSIMPGKVNPVISEAVLMACAQVMGNDLTITLGGQSGNFQLNTALPLIAYNLIQSIELLSHACTSLAEKAIANMAFDHEKLQERLWLNPILVTALAEKLGYDTCADIVKRVNEQKCSVLEAAQSVSGLPREELQALLDPANLVKHYSAEPEA